jgi:hypothetical protein
MHVNIFEDMHNKCIEDDAQMRAPHARRWAIQPRRVAVKKMPVIVLALMT